MLIVLLLLGRRQRLWVNRLRQIVVRVCTRIADERGQKIIAGGLFKEGERER